MASFSAEVKNALSRTQDERPCCRAAELAALMRMCASVAIGGGRGLGVNFTTENAAVARKTLTLIKESFQLKTEVVVRRGRRLKKHNVYTIRVVPAPMVTKLLLKIGLMSGDSLNMVGDRKLLRRACCRHAYLRGAFLGGGSVSKPESGYHLELVASSYQLASLLLWLCKRFYLPAGLTDRKSDYIVYLKDGDAVTEFLRIIGAEAAADEFEVVRNVKDVRNQVNRLVNCETANLQKTVDAACRQVEKIHRIEARQGLDKLPPALREAALLRLAHPEATLQELVALTENRVGKSGMNHRLRKLEKIADALGGESC